ncbi:MAG: flagellar motor protein MotB, partial [Lysinibacillus sp.]
MAKKAKRHKHEEHVDESWLVPYADILTLLLALFIVLFASSSVDQDKLERMSAVFNQVFEGGTGVFENPSPTESIDADSQDVQKAVNRYAEDQKQLSETQEKVEQLIAVNELENQFQSTMTDDGLLITIRDSVLFESGKAEIRPEQRDVAIELGNILNFDPARNVVITGHTDNVPIANSAFDSNWELSVSRALNFLKIIINSNEDL